MDWFTVDKEGLAKLLERKGKAFVLYELLQNAWDTNATEVRVQLKPLPNKPYCSIVVTDDDSAGFSNLAHAFTLFAESEKKGDPEKRGRFNLGEKLVLALCEEASIASTTGTIAFDKSGRHRKQAKTEKGSVFTGTIRMTRAEYDEVCQAMQRLIVPHDRRTWFNDAELNDKPRKDGFRTTLPTEISDAEGFLRRSARETLVQLHEVGAGETATLYEMGIPVVELDGGEPWHINIHQKVPLNSDRDNVTPAYLRDVRTAVLNHMHRFIKGADAAAQAWVREAAADPDASKEAVEHVKTERFGEKAVAYDPSDPEGSKMAMQQGYTVIPGGSLSKGEWDNLKRDKIVLPAGQVTPSKPEGFADTTWVGEDKQTPGMKALAKLVQRLGEVLIDRKVSVFFVEAPEASTLAQWSLGKMTFNVSTLGKRFFTTGVTEKQVDLILHELGHNMASDHLSKNFNDALTYLGAKLAFFISENPTFFKDFSW
jgi:hypothetical protein